MVYVAKGRDECLKWEYDHKIVFSRNERFICVKNVEDYQSMLTLMAVKWMVGGKVNSTEGKHTNSASVDLSLSRAVVPIGLKTKEWKGK